MALKPLGKRLVVQQIPVEETQTGIVIPQSFSDGKLNTYKVLAVGSKCDLDLKIGSKVLLDSRRLAVGNVRDAQLIEQDQILAIV